MKKGCLPSVRDACRLAGVFWLPVFFMAGLLVAACRKAIPQAPAGINPTGVSDPGVLRLIDRINRGKGSLTFYNKVAQTYGTAHWDQALCGMGDQTLVCLVPFSRPGARETSAVLAIEWANRLQARVLDAESYPPAPGPQAYERERRLIHFFNFLLWGAQTLSPEGIKFSRIRSDPAPDQLQTFIAVPYVYAICYEWVACTGDGFGNCIGNITYHSDCVTSVGWTEQYSYGAGGGFLDPPLPGGGGSFQENDPSAAPALLQPPRKVIGDLKTYLGCFDTNAGATITVYADQPQAGSDEPFTILGKMGHAFLSIDQTVGSQFIRRNIGFYPASPVNPFNATIAPSGLGNDSDHRYDVKLSFPLTSQALAQVIKAIQTYPPTYDLENYNCVDFVLDVAAAGGLQLPRTSGWWIFGRGRNPGSLGQDLRSRPGVITQKGRALFNTGTCP